MSLHASFWKPRLRDKENVHLGEWSWLQSRKHPMGRCPHGILRHRDERKLDPPMFAESIHSWRRYLPFWTAYCMIDHNEKWQMKQRKMILNHQNVVRWHLLSLTKIHDCESRAYHTSRSVPFFSSCLMGFPISLVAISYFFLWSTNRNSSNVCEFLLSLHNRHVESCDAPGKLGDFANKVQIRRPLSG